MIKPFADMIPLMIITLIITLIPLIAIVTVRLKVKTMMIRH